MTYKPPTIADKTLKAHLLSLGLDYSEWLNLYGLYKRYPKSINKRVIGILLRPNAPISRKSVDKWLVQQQAEMVDLKQ